VPAGDGGTPKTVRRIREAGADRPPTGGVLNITAAVWTAGFHWWRSGNKKRTQNVRENMLVLALCLVKVLSSEAWCKGRAVRSHLVNEERMSPVGDFP